MITEQRQYPGYEHTDEFRVPQIGERYQDECGQPRYCEWNFSKEEMAQHGGKRWILKKVEAVKTQDASIRKQLTIIDEMRECLNALAVEIVRKP